MCFTQRSQRLLATIAKIFIFLAAHARFFFSRGKRKILFLAAHAALIAASAA